MSRQGLDAKRDEFLALLNQVVSVQRPRLDYSKLSNPNLVSCEFIRRLMEVQAFFIAHSRATGKLPATKKDIDHILTASIDLTPIRLAAIYCAHPDAVLVGLLVDLEIEELFIGAEIEKRLADKRIGTVMILGPFFGGSKPSVKWLTKELKVDKIKTYGRDKAVEDHDVRYDSVIRSLELAANLEAPPYAPGPMPQFPLEMRPNEASFWNIALTNVWRKGHETLRKGLIAVLNGDAERIPTQVKDYRKEEWKKILRREAIARGADEFPTKGPAAWRANWDWGENAQTYRSHDIRTQNRPKRPRDEDVNLASIQMKEIVKIAKEKLGSRAALAFKLMAQDLTDQEIAARLNVSLGPKAKKISSDTVRSYRVKMAKIVRRK